ncbi:MAG: hypothetical protein ACE5FN_01125 [Leptospirillia bacterium]
MSAWVERSPEPVRRALLAAAIVLSGFDLFLSRFSIRFATNDDTTMQLIAMGFYTDGVPSPHLMLVGLPLGFLLKGLYTVFPGVQWYSIILVGSHFIGSVALWYVFLGHWRRGFVFAAFVLGFLFLESELLMQLQFTSATMVLATGGLVLLLDALLRGQSFRPVAVVVAGFMVALSGFIRFKAMGASVLLALPLFLIVLGMLLYRAKRRLSHPAVRSVTAFALVVVLVLGGGLAFEKFYYADKPGWVNYFDYRKQQARVLGYPQLMNDPRLPVLIKQVGWSPNDFFLWQRYFFFDHEIYSSAHLKTIADELQFSSGGKAGGFSRQVATLGQYRVFFQVASAVLLIALLAAPLASWAVILMMAGWSALVIYGFVTFMRLPAQLALPVIFVATVLIAFSGCIQSAGLPSRWRMALAALPGCFLLFVLGVHVDEQSSLSSKNDRASVSALTQMENLRRLDPNGTFLNWLAVLRVEDMSPLTPPAQIPRLRTINTGWQTFSPLSDAFLNRKSPGDVYRGIFAPRKQDGGNLWLMLPRGEKQARYYMGLITRFMREHHGSMVARAQVVSPRGAHVHLLLPGNENGERPVERDAP